MDAQTRSRTASAILILGLLVVPAANAASGYFESFSDGNDPQFGKPVAEPTAWYTFTGTRAGAYNGGLNQLCTLVPPPAGISGCTTGTNARFTLPTPHTGNWRIEYDVLLHDIAPSLSGTSQLSIVNGANTLVQVFFAQHQTGGLLIRRPFCTPSSVTYPAAGLSFHIRLEYTAASQAIAETDSFGGCTSTASTVGTVKALEFSGAACTTGSSDATRCYYQIDNLAWDDFSGATYSLTPSAPQSLAATPSGADAIDLAWQVPLDEGRAPITGYNVFRGTGPGAETLVTTGGCSNLGAALACTDAGLPSGSTFYYKVKATNEFGEGDESAEATTSTLSLPQAPQNPAVTHGPGNDGLTLTWGSPANSGSGPVTSYRIYGGDSVGQQDLLAEQGPGDFDFEEAGLGYSHTRYYRVSTVTSVGEGPTALASGTTLSPGRMQIQQEPFTHEPQCSTVPSDSEDYCNSIQYGYTNAIDVSNPDAPAFTLDWGDFNGHEHVGCGTQACTFWLRFNLEVNSPATSYTAYNGETVPIAHLERQEGSSWQLVPNGDISAEIDAPSGQPWSLLMPGNLLLTHEALATSQGSATFRLVPETRPDGDGLWNLSLAAAMGQLVAPPLVMVHGWDPEADKAVPDYTHRAGWRAVMEERLIDRSRYVYGQDPWAWSQDDAIRNVEFHGKADIRLSAFDVYDEILGARSNPAGQGALTYDGPVNIMAHSLGGLVSRYFVETVIPFLQNLDGGAIDPGDRAPTFIEAKLNEYSQENMPGQSDLVSSVVMMGTPHLGSGQAKPKLVLVDLGYQTNNCIHLQCYRYYKDLGGGNVLSYWVSGVSAKAWWEDNVGAYRNPALDLGTTSVMADFELMKVQDGNPVINELDKSFAPPGVPYFLVAGDYFFTGDGHVSKDSATHGHDDAVCYRTYNGWELAYGTATGTPEHPTYDSNVFGTAYHNDLPKDRKVQHDALVFMAGGKSSVCDNSPGYASQSMGDRATGASLLESGAMSMNGLDTLESESPVTYETPVGFNFTATQGAYSMRIDWLAPGSSNGTLALVATNGTLANAAVQLRSPSGGTATLATGNTSWAAWSGPTAVDIDHILELRMPNAEPGAWSLWINRTTIWPGFVVPQLVFETPVAIETESDAQGVIGEPVVYRVRLTDAGSPVLGATITLELLDLGTETPVTLTLGDDGMGADSAAGDGVYSATHTFQAEGSAPYIATAAVGGSQFSVEGGIAILGEAPAPRVWPPSRPLNLTATRGPGGGEITLTWQPFVSNGGSPVTCYDIYRANETGVQTFLARTSNASTYTDADLDPNATHTYTVAARNAIGYSHRSNEANATTFDLPSAPRNLTAAPGQAGEIVLQWEAPVDDGGSSVTNYAVYAGDEAGAEILVATFGNVLTYTETGVDHNVTRHYKIAAVTLAGRGAFSEPAEATTITLAPSAPRNFAVTPGAGAGQLTLNWQAPVDDGGDAVTGYTIYRGHGAAWSPLASVGRIFGYVDSGLGNNATWHYRVAAVNAEGEGAPSNAADATTFDVPPAPQSLVASVGPSAGEITLTWQPPASDGGTPVTNYTVYAGNLSGALVELVVLGPVSNYTESGLPDDATRYYALTATNLAGESPRSNVTAASAFDVPTQPLDLEATPGISNVTLSWQPPTSNGGTPVASYNVYRGNAAGELELYVSVGNLTYLDDNATPGARYHYAVAALNIAGEGSPSNETSTHPSSLLLTVPSVPLPPLAVPSASVVITVCDASSAAGCAVPGQSHVCIELHLALQPTTTLACVEHALLRPEIDSALHGLSPIEVGDPGVPFGAFGRTPEIQVTYLHEASLLGPVLVACTPLHPLSDDATWLLANGNETSLTVTLKTQPGPGNSVTIPWLGQVVAASQATTGAIPCA